MKIAFVAGFGPIVRDVAASRAFYGDGLGIALEEISTDYYGNDDLGGVNAFALWPLSQAASPALGPMRGRTTYRRPAPGSSSTWSPPTPSRRLPPR